MRYLRFALVACVAVLAVTTAAAQSGGITVVVTDDEGQPLPGATVTISHATGSVKTTAESTNKNGIVEFPVLRPGPGYSITVAFPTYSAVRYDDLRVKISEQWTLPVQMSAEIQERVKVTAERDIVDLEKTETSTKFTDNFINDLPVAGRFYQNVLTMAPGVQDADGDGNPNVHGSRNRDFQALVGNVSNVDPLTGQWMSRINPNSIEEMEVITAGAGVEFGRAQGGFARIIQKQGTNTHEGVVELFMQSSKLDGTGANDTSAQPDPKYDVVQPLMQFSGPLVKDKLWYRASYERRDTEQPVNILSGVAVTTSDTETRDAQVTWQVSPRNKLAMQYRGDPFQRSNLGISNFVSPDASIFQKQGVDTYTLTWTAPYSPKVLVETTAAWQDQNIFTGPEGSGNPNACVGEDVDPFLRDAQCTDLENGRQTGAFPAVNDDNRQRLTVKGQATVYGGRFWGMSHQFKLGISIENERYFRSLTRSPDIAYYVVEDPNNDPNAPEGESDPQRFGIAFANLFIPETDDVRATGTNWAIYAEDQFKPTSDLTITVGARIDREEIASEGRLPFLPVDELAAYQQTLDDFGVVSEEFGSPGASGELWVNGFTAYEDFKGFQSGLQQLICSGVSPDAVGGCFLSVDQSINAGAQNQLTKLRRQDSINIANSNVSPFLSVAWSPFDNGKTAFKASSRRAYNTIPLIVPLQELNPAFTSLQYRVDLNTGLVQLQGGINPTVNVSTVNRNIRTPYQDEWTFSMERELWTETLLTFTYINRKFKDQIQDFNVNLDIGDFGRCQIQTVNLPPVVASPGTGELIDPFTGEVYMDADPGPGDGRLDDCIGDTVTLNTDPDEPVGQFGDNIVQLQRPDGITDLYVQNPFWGDIFEIGNYNEIDYQGYVLELVRRQYRSWEMSGSYTYSKAEGNGEDFFQALGDDPSLRNNVRGFQSYDQRHVVKVNATSITPWGVRLGTSVSWQSGLPFSLLQQQSSFDTLPPSTGWVGNIGTRQRQEYVTGTRNDQRNESYWNVDLKATKEFRLGKGLNLQVSAEVFNLMDDDTYTVYNSFFERGQQVNGNNEAFRRFGRQWQVGMKVAF